MGNEASLERIVMKTKDEEFDAIIQEISLEIDDDYKEINSHTENNNHLQRKEQKDSHTNTSATSIDSVKRIKSINELYIYQKPLGQGVSGSVILVKSKQTHKQYALKQMQFSKQNKSSFLSEINVLRSINHPNIVTFDNAYISNSRYYITTAYCSGGTLLERVKIKHSS